MTASEDSPDWGLTSKATVLPGGGLTLLRGLRALLRLKTEEEGRG